MTTFLVRRLISLIFVLFSLTFVTFMVGHFAPGDPILVMMGPHRDPDTYQRLRHAYGLDKPLLVQYAAYVGGLAQGNFGLSLRYQGRAVWDLIKGGVPVSMGVGGLALIISLLIGIPLGVVAAVKHNSAADRTIIGLTLLLYSIPSFVLIPIAWLVVRALYDAKLPAPPIAGWGTWQNWILPVTILAAGSTGYLTRLTRSTMIETLRQEYVRTARAKGLRNGMVTWKHAFRNALLPVITVVGPSVAFLITGAFVVENLLKVPGIGFLTVQAIGQRDYPVIQGTTVLLGVAVVLMNLVTDLAYTVLDPRIRLE
ncbi:MAG: ABC transporter permease [Herpetosiphonaceae bacterium]|nr:ABC transporter permease [Herpetosiphonaceae bacterium]